LESTYSEARAKLTADGGFAVLLRAGEDLIAGEVVYVPQTGTGNDGEVRKAPTSSDMPIGVVYASAKATEGVWVVTNGRVAVLPEAGVTVARGNVIYTSASEAGRVAQSATAPTNDHWRECGHYLVNGTGAGVAAMAVLHFN
jgi:hypothetical protein